MRVRGIIKYGIVCVLLSAASGAVKAQGKPYLCEAGVQAGIGYYVGEAAPHIFMDVRETYGVQFRYKFTKRWALAVKGQAQMLTGPEYLFESGKQPVMLDTKWQNLALNIDVMAEFNFFRFGAANKYDKRIRPYTPYITLGIGCGVYGAEGYTNGNFDKVMAYLPVGIGFKWKFHERCGLNILWQHNLYFADNLDNRTELDNRHGLNGTNMLNCDLTGAITLGVVFEFGEAKKPCRICNTD